MADRAPEVKRQCSNCAFAQAQELEKEAGGYQPPPILLCHRRAPLPYEEKNRGWPKTIWPEVHPEDWCGEWEWEGEGP